MPSKSSSTRVLVLAGGESGEHEVSIVSARSMLAALANSNLDPTTVVVTKHGQWLSPSDSQRALADGSADSGGELTLRQAKITQDYAVVFPLIHGPHGEDGTIQGMLELAGIPYVGSGVLASALCMDKPMAKTVLDAHQIPQVNWEVVTRHEFDSSSETCVERASHLNSPWYVKPANMGSSVGITRAETLEQLKEGIAQALTFDRRVIIEEGAGDARELEVGILGNDAPKASTVGEITFDTEWYDYETKYTDGKAELHIPADVSPELSERIRALGVKVFTLLDCAGFARIDFFYRSMTDELLVNEVNTIPGFTPTSMFPQLWEHAGLPYPQLIEKLVELAQERHEAKPRGT